MSVPKYPNYKSSGIEWLGDIPAHWSLGRLKRSTLAVKNGTWGDNPQADENDIPCVRVADFDRTKLRAILNEPTIRNVSRAEQYGRLLANGDLLLEKSGGGEHQPVGCVVLYDYDIPAVCSNFVARIRCSQEQDPSFWRYVHAAAYAVRLNTRSIKQTSGIQNLDHHQYFDEITVFPPFSEQQSIARFLDRETGKIDALIVEQQRLLELLTEKRQAVISHAVTKGISSGRRMLQSGIDWIGEVPETWRVLPLGQLCVELSYGFTNPMPTMEDGPYMLTANDIGYGVVRYDSARRTSREAFATALTNKSRPKANDVLITKDGTLGRVALHDGREACINQSVAFLRIAANVALPAFVATCLLASIYQDRLLFDAGGTTIKHIYISRLAKMHLACPPLAEQREIVDFLNEKIARLDGLQAEAERSVGLLRERRAALISAAVTGKIDVRHLADAEAA